MGNNAKLMENRSANLKKVAPSMAMFLDLKVLLEAICPQIIFVYLNIPNLKPYMRTIGLKSKDQVRSRSTRELGSRWSMSWWDINPQRIPRPIPANQRIRCSTKLTQIWIACLIIERIQAWYFYRLQTRASLLRTSMPSPQPLPPMVVNLPFLSSLPPTKWLLRL